MKQTLETKTDDGKVHCWEGLTEFKLDNPENFLNSTEDKIEEVMDILNKMKPNQYYVAKTMPAKEKNTAQFDNYINNLKSLGLDIGKGECEYGCKMPFPEKGEYTRKLIIFRRK